MRKQFCIFLLVIFTGYQSLSQIATNYEVITLIKSSPLKNQQSSGTCWSFATTSFIETEAIRLGKEPISLSPIFYVAPTYMSKAEKYIELKGDSFFDAGDLTFSVLEAYRKYGAIPEEVYNGILSEDWQHDHVEMDNLLEAMVESVGASGYGRIKPNSWRVSVEAVLEAYMGNAPDTFLYQGKVYSPKSFASTFVGINTDDYLEITSYKKYPFYEQVELDIPANWDNKKYLNLPIKDFEKVIDDAISLGYSLTWDGDASEPDFNFESGILKLSNTQEKSPITQKLREDSFDDGTTTDDHNMHIIGIAKNEKGELFYIMKNSEGDNDTGGYIYMSKKALLLKTISVMVHKDAIPTEIKSRINLSN